MENFASNTQIHEYSLKEILLLLLLIFSFSSFTQPLSTENKKAKKLYFKADKKYKERDFEGAIDILRDATDLDNSFYEAYLRKGSLFNALGQEDSVYSNFSKYVTYSLNPSASVLERLAHMAFDRGQYEKAQNFLDGFLARVPEKENDREIDLLKRSIPFAMEQIENPIKIEIEELSASINQYALQYLPTMTVDGQTMVYTKRDRFSDDEDIVISKFENGVWQMSESISENINSSFNEGAATISADGRIMIFTACDRKDSYGSCDLYISRKLGDNWSRPKNLGKFVNSKYWESQPSLSADGRTLYFATNRPGGYGGRDIWVSKLKDNSWTPSLNMGKNINSFKDETTPFIHFNGKTLYFSSNSYTGLGGFDLFHTEKEDSSWARPKNLGYPLNTFRDEVALLVSADSKVGYFALEKQKNREIQDSKIVKYRIPENLKPSKSYYLSGKVLDKLSNLPLRAGLQIIDIISNEVLYENKSDSLTGEYYLVLPEGRRLAGYVKKKGYLYEDFNFSTVIEKDVNVDTLDIFLSPIAKGESIILKNIYFETDSFELDSRSKSEIMNVVELLNDNPEVAIEINGHTDDIGNKSYNQELSEKRALSVYKGLVENGISPTRLVYFGFGDTKPIKPNTSDQNRESNRRIEFRVLRSKQ